MFSHDLLKGASFQTGEIRRGGLKMNSPGLYPGFLTCKSSSTPNGVEQTALPYLESTLINMSGLE